MSGPSECKTPSRKIVVVDQRACLFACCRCLVVCYPASAVRAQECSAEPFRALSVSLAHAGLVGPGARCPQSSSLLRSHFSSPPHTPTTLLVVGRSQVTTWASPVILGSRKCCAPPPPNVRCLKHHLGNFPRATASST